MLYWHFRNIQCIIYGIFGKRLADPRTPIKRKFFANPFDSDWMSSIQAGRYFTYTDAARWEIAGRIGFLKVALRKRWIVFLGGQKIIYRKPVFVFRTFQLSTQLMGWDEKWIYAQHEFRQDRELKVISFSKIGVKSQGRLVNLSTIFNVLGFESVVVPKREILTIFEKDADCVRGEL